VILFYYRRFCDWFIRRVIYLTLCVVARNKSSDLARALHTLANRHDPCPRKCGRCKEYEWEPDKPATISAENRALLGLVREYVVRWAGVNHCATRILDKVMR